MPTPPPIEGMHVIVVHFPIALMMVSPLFVLIGAVTGLRSMMASALILMLLGSIGAFAATSTGEEAMGAMGVEGDFPLEDAKYDVAYLVLDEHEEAGHFARNLFAGGTVLYAVVLAVTLLVPKFKKLGPRLALHLLFLAIWAYPAIVMANVAHDGGRLVHEFELRSILAETADGEPDYEAELARLEGEEAVEVEVAAEEEAEGETPDDDQQGDAAGAEDAGDESTEAEEANEAA